MCRSLIGQLQDHACSVLPKRKWMCVLRLQNWPVCALCFCIYHFPYKDKPWNQSSIKSLKNLFHKLWKFLEVAISIIVNNKSIEFGSECEYILQDIFTFVVLKTWTFFLSYYHYWLKPQLRSAQQSCMDVKIT